MARLRGCGPDGRRNCKVMPLLHSLGCWTEARSLTDGSSVAVQVTLSAPRPRGCPGRELVSMRCSQLFKQTLDCMLAVYQQSENLLRCKCEGCRRQVRKTAEFNQQVRSQLADNSTIPGFYTHWECYIYTEGLLQHRRCPGWVPRERAMWLSTA